VLVGSPDRRWWHSQGQDSIATGSAAGLAEQTHGHCWTHKTPAMKAHNYTLTQ